MGSVARSVCVPALLCGLLVLLTVPEPVVVAASTEAASSDTTAYTDSVESRTPPLLDKRRNARRAVNRRDDFVCPDPSSSSRDCPLGRDCEKDRHICKIYRLAFEPLQGHRTRGELTLNEVSLDTCAARCARRAPACRHFSYRNYRGGCILGCRSGSAGCVLSGELIRESGWTFYFASARRLATLTSSILTTLEKRAGLDGAEIREITGSLLFPGRFGEQDVGLGDGRSAVERLFGERERPPAVGSAGDMIANGRETLLPTDCGRRPLGDLLDLVPFIFGGKPAGQGEYPWQALIRISREGSLVHRCGGIIITDRHVLTAAHCLRDVPISTVEVSVGVTDISTFSEHGQRFAVINVRNHEGYGNGSAYRNDIMLLKLRQNRGRSIEFNDFVQPACLPRAGLHYDTETPLVCHVSGWGTTTTQSDAPSKVLRGVKLPLVSDRYCGARENYGSSFFQDVMFCAGFTDGSADSCGGDSGGPLACPLPDSDQYAAYGIVSHGHPDGCGQQPGVYTRLEHYESWVLDAIRKLE